MILDIYNQPPIDPLLWHSLPDLGEPVLERWKIGELIADLYRRPIARSEESLVAIEYSLVITLQEAILAVISLEMEDLRALALQFGCTIDELREEYKTRGNWGPLLCYLYTAEDREHLGPYVGALNVESVREYLLEEALDLFDLIDDPVRLEGEDKGS
ncbi:MAG TPA: hypothetical protein VFC80_03085 [Sphaerochaeta sp.]|nr:hypothetical protein [Sphaerochaeta sp.]